MAQFVKLSDENLEDVSGGYSFGHRGATDSREVYEAIDDSTGNVVATFYDKDECYNYCMSNGLSPEFLSPRALDHLRKYGLV